MDENLFTEAKDEALSIITDSVKDINKMFKGKLPYNQRQISNRELIDAYLNLTIGQKNVIRQKYDLMYGLGTGDSFFLDLDKEINNNGKVY